MSVLGRNHYNYRTGRLAVTFHWLFSRRWPELPGVRRGRSEGMITNLSGQSVVVAAKEQVSCNLEGEAAILNLANGIYYGLDLIGVQVWTLLQQPRRVEEIRDAVLREYEVEPERCQSDLLSLLQRLLAEGLIEVRDGPAA